MRYARTPTVTLTTGIEPSRSRQIPFPFTKTLTTEYIVKFARKLWEEATQPMNKGNMKLNNVRSVALLDQGC
jgi:DNA polymerase eta